jgi:hypothetical protein
MTTKGQYARPSIPVGSATHDRGHRREEKRII